MSWSCLCSERHRPFEKDLPVGSNDRPRQWFVLRRNYSVSAFNGGNREWSDFSDIECRVCGARWRSRALYVDYLRDDGFFPQTVAPRVPPLKELR